jgi:hypothetical protein
MGNGVLPHGPSYRAHPRLYLPRDSKIGDERLLSEGIVLQNSLLRCERAIIESN